MREALIMRMKKPMQKFSQFHSSGLELNEIIDIALFIAF